MALSLPELDSVTREYMLREFDAEQAQLPVFTPTVLSVYGQARWPTLMHDAIEFGDDTTLHDSLLYEPAVFNQSETYHRLGVIRPRRVNIHQAAERLATNEFNTSYVRGISARCLTEGVDQVEIYRAAEPKRTIAACSEHEGAIVSVQKVYDGHRAKYWPAANPDAFSIPFQPGCHHSIRRAA